MKLIEASRFLGAAVLVGTLAACGGKGNSKEFVPFAPPSSPQALIELGSTIDCSKDPSPKREEVFLRNGQEFKVLNSLHARFNAPDVLFVIRGEFSRFPETPENEGIIMDLAVDRGIKTHIETTPVVQPNLRGNNLIAEFTCVSTNEVS